MSPNSTGILILPARQRRHRPALGSLFRACQAAGKASSGNGQHQELRVAVSASLAATADSCKIISSAAIDVFVAA